MQLRLLLVLGLGLIALPSCDLIEVVPPEDIPPPGEAFNPYGEGRGKVMIFSDLTAAERIDVSLGGEEIGSVRRFTGCYQDITDDDGLAVAIRPVGTYQVTARSTTGLTWSFQKRIEEGEIAREVLVGPPSLYLLHLPNEIEGREVVNPADQFAFDTELTAMDIVVRPSSVVQGDRYDLVFNGRVLARDTPFGTMERAYSVQMQPGPNYAAVRLSTDVGSDGTSAGVYIVQTGGSSSDSAARQIGLLSSDLLWRGINFRHDC